MKALLSHAPGGPETLQLTELPEPVPGPGELWSAFGRRRSTIRTC
jgi:NADPH:quinone reductase-like Zn-dependent oxidoreductase